METGSGTLLALDVEVASCEPNTDRIMPGAKVCLKEAPLVRPASAGLAFEPVEVTETVTEALTLFEELSRYTAVIVPELCCNCVPFTGNVAVAVPADPTRVADPSDFPPASKSTLPDGVTPLGPVAVATRKTTSVAATLFRLLSRVMLVFCEGGGTAPVV